MNILFRCDGSQEIGMGHVIRCLALADELENKYKCNITFAMRKSELGIKKVKKKYKVFTPSTIFCDHDYEEWLQNCITTTKSSILILDSRDGLSRESVSLIKRNTKVKVVTIDDTEDKRLESDLAFYPPVPQLTKMKWYKYSGRLLSGWEYVILRKEFSKNYPKPKNQIPVIVVSMGGTDPFNLTELVVDSLQKISAHFTVTIIIGDGYAYKYELLKKISNCHFTNTLLVDPPNISSVMAKSDFAIISFGQTAYELAAIKIPSLYLCISDDHCISSKIFEEEGFGLTIGVFNEINSSDFQNLLFNFISNKQYIKYNQKMNSGLEISDLDKISTHIKLLSNGIK